MITIIIIQKEIVIQKIKAKENEDTENEDTENSGAEKIGRQRIVRYINSHLSHLSLHQLSLIMKRAF